MSAFESRWSAEDIAKVRDLREAGWSKTVIAKEFGVTRNAICGLIWREGIVGPTRPGPQKAKIKLNGHAARNARKRAAKDASPARLPFQPKSAFGPQPTAPVAIPARVFEPLRNTKPITIAELTHCTCRWPAPPVSEGEPMRYCGAPAMSVSPYCTNHHKRAYVKAPVPRWARPKPAPPLSRKVASGTNDALHQFPSLTRLIRARPSIACLPSPMSAGPSPRQPAPWTRARPGERRAIKARHP